MNYTAAAHYNRRHRRRLVAFGKAAGGVVHTALIPSGASLRGHTHSSSIARAIASWCAAGSVCFCCRQPFAAGDAVGAFLVAINARAPASAVGASAVCCACWRDRDDAEIESAAVRILQAALPHGRFIDPNPSSLGDQP